MQIPHSILNMATDILSPINRRLLKKMRITENKGKSQTSICNIYMCDNLTPDNPVPFFENFCLSQSHTLLSI